MKRIGKITLAHPILKTSGQRQGIFLVNQDFFLMAPASEIMMSKVNAKHCQETSRTAPSLGKRENWQN